MPDPRDQQILDAARAAVAAGLGAQVPSIPTRILIATPAATTGATALAGGTSPARDPEFDALGAVMAQEFFRRYPTVAPTAAPTATPRSAHKRHRSCIAISAPSWLIRYIIVTIFVIPTLSFSAPILLVAPTPSSLT